MEDYTKPISSSFDSPRALMADYTKPISSFFDSPRFRAFTTKGFSETDVLLNTSSVFEVKPFFPLHNHRSPEKKETFSNSKHSWENLDSKGISLAIEEDSAKPNTTTKVLFSTKLKIQIPTFTLISDSPKSPVDFGTRTRYSEILKSGGANSSREMQGVILTRRLLASDMQLSEDYTCVKSHGPNPRTTHIFENFIVETDFTLPDNKETVKENFLSSCFTCKKNLEQKNDIYIYRGEKAFCSNECRSQEMLLDELENSEL